MAQIEAKLNEVEAWGGETTQLPPGPYQFRIKAADVESKEANDGSTKLQLVLTNEVLSGPLAGKDCKSWFMLNLAQDVSRKRLKSLVVATGIALDGQGNFDSAQLVGCRYNADVVHETYDGKPDPMTGQSVQKTAIKIVNERAYGAIASPDNKPTGEPTRVGVAVGGTPGLPGLTKA